MPDKNIFLTANWEYLLLANYAVPKSLLTPLVPKDCVLSLWKDQSFVSVVAFQFNNTKVFKFRWPYFTNFIEINLRFYLEYKEQRAVCFIREFVPSYLIAGIARLFYNEPYKAVKITNALKNIKDTINLQYQVPVKNHLFRMDVTADNQPYMPNRDSAEFFFKEHNLGVGKTCKGKTLLYDVYHPEWQVFPIKNTHIEIDWKFFFGEKFVFLENVKPASVFLAKGSAVTVYKPKILSNRKS